MYVDGHTSSNVLQAVAVRHFNNVEKGYFEMPHNSKAENEFCNPQLFPRLYPTLFPYGLGGFEDCKWSKFISV